MESTPQNGKELTENHFLLPTGSHFTVTQPKRVDERAAFQHLDTWLSVIFKQGAGIFLFIS